MWPEKKNPGWEHATGLEQMERQYWKEIQAKNWKEIEAHTASNYRHTSPAGVVNKQQMLERYQQAGLQNYSLGDFTVESHGDTATISYTANLQLDGQPKQSKSVRRLSVWQKQKSGWVLIASSETQDQGTGQ